MCGYTGTGGHVYFEGFVFVFARAHRFTHCIRTRNGEIIHCALSKIGEKMSFSSYSPGYERVTPGDSLASQNVDLLLNQTNGRHANSQRGLQFTFLVNELALIVPSAVTSHFVFVWSFFFVISTTRKAIKSMILTSHWLCIDCTVKLP